MLGQIKAIAVQIKQSSLNKFELMVVMNAVMTLCDKLADDLFQEPDEHEAYEKAAGDGL